MNYTVKTIIQKPLEEVLEQFHEPSNYMKWMPGIRGHQTVVGAQREAGSKSIFEFTTNGRDFTIEETVMKNNRTEVTAKYVSNGTVNTQITRFSTLAENQTVYEVHESFELKGFMRVIGFLMPGSFKKQTKEFVEAFKNFAEKR